MITLFTTPKPFTGHTGMIQENALRSWTLLGPDVRVVLFGDEPGAREMAARLNVIHQPRIARNEYGTPLLDDLFAQAETLSDHRYFCYINADILLLSDFRSALVSARRRKRQFLMVGRRTDLDVNEPVKFELGWEDVMKAAAKQRGKLQRPTAIDYFVFNRGLYGRLPPFAVGRTAWDNWMIYRARLLRASVIDATEAVTCVHQNHDYTHANHVAVVKPEPNAQRRGYKWIWHGPEAKLNLALAGGQSHLYTIWDCTHQLSDEGLRPRDPLMGLGGGIWSYRRSKLYPLAG